MSLDDYIEYRNNYDDDEGTDYLYSDEYDDDSWYQEGMYDE